MRCKKHPGDLTTTVGVCASCLRERLLSLIAAQLQAEAQLPLPYSHSRSSAAAAVDHSRKSDSAAAPTTAQPPPLIFPRSVSPYVAPRRESDQTPSHHPLFFSTPQVNPIYNNNCYNNNNYRKKKHARFSLLTNLFRSKSDKLNHPDPSRNSSSGAVSSTSSPVWFSGIFSSSRSSKKQSPNCPADISVRQPRRRIVDRGMSPARGADSDDDCADRSPSGSGSSGESTSSHWSKRTPISAPAAAASAIRRSKTGHVSSSGLAFCLSPLVRASPNRHWNQKGGAGSVSLPPDIGYSGEIRVPAKPHLSTASLFCANRSRKLCDLGRVNLNRP
ncbi:uncharacterized protein LOC126679602 [Mercurialis annua]|uniref:uncharacterized protein LOC126679602 n=1 Tax=Mercurialis annua TaxID=3986 RepID=UPI00215DD8AD|nr:uncharacterized protein LOC126679602 [Mercurialis annua]